MDGTLGDIRAFAGSYAPESWALCDGTHLPISGNEPLFSLIGTTYGGDGTSDFALPNLCGRAIVKFGTGTGLSPYAIGQQGGFEGVELTTANLAPHTHTVSVSTSDSNASNPTGNYLSAMIDTGNPTYTMLAYLPNNPADTNQSLVTLNDNTISAAYGGNQPHENRMPFIAMTYIICTQGLYPDLQ